MQNTSEEAYIVNEKDILRISEIMDCMENAVKKIIRSSRNGTVLNGYREIAFFETPTNTTLNQAENDNYFYRPC